MDVRLIGPPDEVRRVVAQLTEFYDLADVSRPYPCRGDNRSVRVYLTIHQP